MDYREYAIRGLDAEIADTEKRLNELRAVREQWMDGGMARQANTPELHTQAKTKTGRTAGRRLSKEARKRLSDAMKRRWEERRKAKSR